MEITAGWASAIIALLALFTGIVGTGLTLLVKSWWRMEDKIEDTNANFDRKIEDTNTNFDRKIENLRTENQKAHSEIRTNIDGLKNVLIANKINSQQRPDA